MSKRILKKLEAAVDDLENYEFLGLDVDAGTYGQSSADTFYFNFSVTTSNATEEALEDYLLAELSEALPGVDDFEDTDAVGTSNYTLTYNSTTKEFSLQHVSDDPLLVG